MKYLLGAAILLAAANPAIACLNDTEVIRSEEQFRSGYERPANKPKTFRNLFGWDLLGMSTGAAGAGMIGLVSFKFARARK